MKPIGRQRHTQVFVKVNAEVDIGIAELVSALSLFPGLLTYASCAGQLGSNGKDSRAAFVDFHYGKNWSETAQFVFEFLAPGLFELLGGAAWIKLQWEGGNGTPAVPHRATATLQVRPSLISDAVEALNTLYKRFTRRGAIHHKYRSSRGREYKVLRS